MKRLVIEPSCLNDFLEIAVQDKQQFKRIAMLIRNIQQDPFQGLGKPEPLRFEWSGYWSRRIDDKNRLVYKVTDDEVVIVACRSHYNDR